MTASGDDAGVRPRTTGPVGTVLHASTSGATSWTTYNWIVCARRETEISVEHALDKQSLRLRLLDETSMNERITLSAGTRTGQVKLFQPW